jgi:mono/diheme cytochrome c family protein
MTNSNLSSNTLRLACCLTALALSSACEPAALTDPGEVDAGETNNTTGGGDTNPFTGDAQAIVDGKALYDANGCANCHGADGSLDTFKSLFVSAADSTDQEIFDAIKDGVPGTSMVSYSSTFSDDEIWKIGAWVRSLDGGSTNNGGSVNPFDGDAAEATAGKAVYDSNGCANCHGADGKSTNFKDLSVSATMTEDQVLFDAIKNGVPNSAMVAYSSAINDDDIWRIVTWIRTIE